MKVMSRDLSSAILHKIPIDLDDNLGLERFSMGAFSHQIKKLSLSFTIVSVNGRS